MKPGNSKASWRLPQIEPAVHKYVGSRNIAVDHTRHGASRTPKRYWPSEMEGAQTTNKAASDSMKDATTVSSPAGNGSSKPNSYNTFRTKGSLIGHSALFPRMGSQTQNTELGPRQTSHITRNQQFRHYKNLANSLYP